MKAQVVPILLVCLYALPWLGGCSLQHKPQPPPQPALQPASVIEVPQPAYQPLPVQLTSPIDKPAAPAPHCTFMGAPAICVLDGLLWIEQWEGKLDSANADRATSAAITAGKPP